MKKPFSLSNIFIILCGFMFCLSMYLEVILRDDIVKSEHSFEYSLVANIALSIFLLLIGAFSVLPKQLKRQFILNSWLYKYADLLLQILQPGLGLGAFLFVILTLILYILLLR
jgi:hypothetical protein